MIAREWKCLCPEDTAAGFLKHLRATGVAETEALPGCRGHQILRRSAGPGLVEITLLTYWESLEAMRAFAGDEARRAVLYPGDEAFRIVPEKDVRYAEVLEMVMK